ncbi:MAG: amidohydrolase family protein [Thermoleophilia bacterium]|nr:amidohydrolase family protein [Thermoleophilia bacterium]
MGTGDVFERAAALIAAYDAELRSLVPEGAEIFDAHVHVGRDIDGFVAPLDDLLATMRHYGVSRAFAFCLDEPDRHPAFRAANDRTLAAAERSAGRLIPFVRLDLAEQPVEEAVRSLDRGARGIKLHPRAQRFLLNDERLAPIFELAADRRVPILIHGGRGLPPIAEELRRLMDAYPEAQLIIAHGGIADLADLSDAFARRRGVFFDTSVWNPIDLLDVFQRFSPEQGLYASDYPYGQQPTSLLIAVRVARAAGLSDAQLRDVLGRTASRIADGEPPVEPSEPSRRYLLEQPISFVRIHNYLAMATPLLWTRQPDTIGVLGLALNACRERDGHTEARERIAELVSCARDLWRTVGEAEDDDERMRLGRTTFRLLHLADIEAVTAVA